MGRSRKRLQQNKEPAPWPRADSITAYCRGQTLPSGGRLPPGSLKLGGIPLGLLLLDFVFQDGHLSPARDRMGGHAPAEAYSLLGYAKAVAPEGVTLGEGAPENRVFRYSVPCAFHSAAFRHFYDLFSINHTKESRTILVTNNSTFPARGHGPESSKSPSFLLSRP